MYNYNLGQEEQKDWTGLRRRVGYILGKHIHAEKKYVQSPTNKKWSMVIT